MVPSYWQGVVPCSWQATARVPAGRAGFEYRTGLRLFETALAVSARCVSTYRRFRHGFGGQAKPGEVHAFFARVNFFRIFDLDGNGPCDKAAFLHEYKQGWNWVAHP